MIRVPSCIIIHNIDKKGERNKKKNALHINPDVIV